MSFAGQGFIIVQPSEEPPGGLVRVAEKKSGGSGGSILGDLFDD